MSLLCKFGIHKWEKWVTVFHFYDKFNYESTKQMKTCNRCHRIKSKYIIPSIIMTKEHLNKNYSCVDEPVSDKVDHVYGSTYNIIKFEQKKDKN